MSYHYLQRAKDLESNVICQTGMAVFDHISKHSEKRDSQRS